MDSNQSSYQYHTGRKRDSNETWNTSLYSQYANLPAYLRQNIWVVVNIMAKKIDVLTKPFPWELTISVYNKKTQEVQLVARYKTKAVSYDRAKEMALEKVAVTSVKDKRKEGVCYFVERL
jgi:hypothetical protein